MNPISVTDAFGNAPPRSPCVLCMRGEKGGFVPAGETVKVAFEITPEMLAWTLCVILISMCLERLLALFFKRIEARGRRLA